jgi:5-methylcytosine-specific restriction endonuclease McrA
MTDFALTGRSVEEWIGKTPDSRPPPRVLDRLFLRQGGRCAISGRKIFPGDITHADHIVPLKDGGANREQNLQLVLADAHRKKTTAENTARAKERRLRLKHHNQWPETKRPLRSRGFPKSRGDYADE